MKHIAEALFCAALFGCLTACVSSVIGNFSKPPGVSDEIYAADYAQCRAEGDRVASQTSLDGSAFPLLAPYYLHTVDECMANKGYSQKK